MATIYIEGEPYTVADGQNLLHACLSLGFDIPYFCWHPALHSVGACRQCAVKQFRSEDDTRGTLVMACMTPATEGTRISIDDPEARELRAAVIERLMVNHPHDCPVCDEGGECHLQDMTVMTGRIHRRFRFRKRTHRNQYLGPLINHEMNRCIGCYRCVRFYRDLAGGSDLEVFGAHDHVYFGRHEDGVLQSSFSGNLVEICPTGVFTDKTLKRHYTRKWDLQTAPSVCVHCGLGCNTIAGERYGLLRRILARYHHEVNGYFLCDRGRFGYEFVNSPRRLRQPQRRRDGRLAPLSADEAVASVAEAVRSSRGVLGIGSPRAPLEANFALRALVGPERFHLGLSDPDHRLAATAVELLLGGPARVASLRDIAFADAALVLGEDVSNTAPMIALALRQQLLKRKAGIAAARGLPLWHDAAVREAAERGEAPRSVFLATPGGAPLDDAGVDGYCAVPDDLARLGFAVARALGADVPAAPGRSEELRERAERIAVTLAEAEHSVIISGLGAGSEAVMQAAAEVAWALCARGRRAQLHFAVPECNTMGLALLGGGDLRSALDALHRGEADTVIVVENDLHRRAGAAAVLDAASRVIVLDHLTTATVERAAIALPAATFAQGSGTLVSSEGRAQRFHRVFTPDGEVRDTWRWLGDVGRALGRGDMAAWRCLDDVAAALAAELPVFARVTRIAPPGSALFGGRRIARQSPRCSGRTAVHAHVDVHEPPPPADEDSALAFSPEGYSGPPPAALLPRYWAPGWNSVQAMGKYQTEVGGPLLGGDSGERLLEPAAALPPRILETPPAFVPRDEALLILPAHHLFGPEELSSVAEGVAEVATQPYLGLNPGDAERLCVGEGDGVTVTIGGVAERLTVRLVLHLPRGAAGWPVGLPAMPAVVLPAWGTVQREVPA